MYGVANLIQRLYEKNEIGVMVPNEKMAEIFVREKSITRSEWNSAGVKGLNPAFVLVTDAVNYNNEDAIEYNGSRYNIYRTFRNSDTDEIELYCEKSIGEHL